MKMRFFFVCLILLMSTLQGCLSDDDDSSSNSSSNCDDDSLDPELYGVWLKHTYHDLTIGELHFQANGERTTHRDDPDFDQACWYIDGDELIYEKIYPQQGKVLWHSNYYIYGDLLFYSQVFSESIDLNGQLLGEGNYNDMPTECYLFYKPGAFTDNTTLNSTINSTQFPDFCTWIHADPTGASPTDAWDSTHYLAQDHADSVTTGSNDNLMTIEIDEFFGEIDWYVSEYNYGFTLNITVNNQYYTCYTNWEDADCIISFSGIDNYYAVWEEFEIATVAENGVDICSVQCDIEINELHLREEDWLPGTASVTVQ